MAESLVNKTDEAIEEHARCSEGWAELYPLADESVLLKHYEEADTLLLPSRHGG